VPQELQEFSMYLLQDMSSISFLETNLQSFSLSLSLEQLQSFCLSGGKAGANPIDTEFLSSFAPLSFPREIPLISRDPHLVMLLPREFPDRLIPLSFL
jgi:hypothetical protein